MTNKKRTKRKNPGPPPKQVEKKLRIEIRNTAVIGPNCGDDLLSLAREIATAAMDSATLQNLHNGDVLYRNNNGPEEDDESLETAQQGSQTKLRDGERQNAELRLELEKVREKLHDAERDYDEAKRAAQQQGDSILAVNNKWLNVRFRNFLNWGKKKNKVGFSDNDRELIKRYNRLIHGPDIVQDVEMAQVKKQTNRQVTEQFGDIYACPLPTAERLVDDNITPVLDVLNKVAGYSLRESVDRMSRNQKEVDEMSQSQNHALSQLQRELETINVDVPIPAKQRETLQDRCNKFWEAGGQTH